MTSRIALVFLAPLAFATACASGGIYDSPYALVESGSPSPVRKELPAAINAVDGRSTLFARRYATAITPGRHQVDVYLSTSTGALYKQYRTIELDAAPCTRYRIVAAYQNLTHVEWTPVIYPEPIGECAAKFASNN
jgi:predicted ATPase